MTGGDLFDDGVALASISHPNHNADMTGPAGTPTELERAKALLLAKATPDGEVLGAVSYLQRTMQIRYFDAVGLIADMEEAGFITEADQPGRRRLL